MWIKFGIFKEKSGMEIQAHYQEAIKFAAARHLEKRQKVKGTNLPYVVHLSNVAMEIMIAAPYSGDNFDLDFALRVALLHDILEDTTVTFDELRERFGGAVAGAVLALSKDKKLPVEIQTIDSLGRIKELREEVWAVKLADRITNLQVPPHAWSRKKKENYREESRLILHALKKGNSFLASRLEEVIKEYGKYI